MLTLELMEKLWHKAQHDYVTNHIALHHEYGRAIEQAVLKECEAELKEAAEHVQSVDEEIFHLKRRSENLQAKVDAIETCCCGEPMDRHSSPMDCGHTPVSMYDHAYSSMKDQAEADARDAARWRMLPAFLEKYQIEYVGLIRDIDAAMAEQEKKG